MITEILLTLCMLGNIGAFCRLMISFKINFFETVLNSLGPDQAGCFVGPDLDPKVCISYQQMTLVDKELSGKILGICHSILVEEIRSFPCGSHISYQFSYQQKLIGIKHVFFMH